MDASSNSPQQMTLDELAAEIGKRLKALSRSTDPAMNPPRGKRNCTFYQTSVYYVGRHIMVGYMGSRPENRLTKSKAALYLQWLRAVKPYVRISCGGCRRWGQGG